MDNEVYVENGYANRTEYLKSLAEEYGDKVYALADLLGENEDFDGLVTSLEDSEDY
jgi:hypothetical protein